MGTPIWKKQKLIPCSSTLVLVWVSPKQGESPGLGCKGFTGADDLRKREGGRWKSRTVKAGKPMSWCITEDTVLSDRASPPHTHDTSHSCPSKTQEILPPSSQTSLASLSPSNTPGALTFPQLLFCTGWPCQLLWPQSRPEAAGWHITVVNTGQHGVRLKSPRQLQMIQRERRRCDTGVSSIYHITQTSPLWTHLTDFSKQLWPRH